MKILIEDYQAAWEDVFLAEAAIIGSALIELHPVVEHIGSTSIPGLCAKPTIDMLVGLPDESLINETISPMVGKGYTYFRKYQPAMPYRRLFARLRTLTDKTPPELIDVDDEFVRGQEFVSAANIHSIT